MPRHDGRAPNKFRPLKLTRGFASAAAGSVLVEWGNTVVLCTASLSEDTPPWLAGKGRGWVTAEYNMLPGSTAPRKKRKTDGRSTEIQRLIGRSLRAAVDLEKLGERTIQIDCDVLRADGGTRTASINGGWIALRDAVLAIRDEDGAPVYTSENVVGPEGPLRDSVGAISVGIVDGQPVMDLDYPEDSTAAVDMNVVATGAGELIEVQGGGEGATFSRSELDALITLALEGLLAIRDRQTTDT